MIVPVANCSFIIKIFPGQFHVVVRRIHRELDIDHPALPEFSFLKVMFVCVCFFCFFSKRF